MRVFLLSFAVCCWFAYVCVVWCCCVAYVVVAFVFCVTVAAVDVMLLFSGVCFVKCVWLCMCFVGVGGSCFGVCLCCVCLLLLLRVVLFAAVCCRVACVVLFGVGVVALLRRCGVCGVTAAAWLCFVVARVYELLVLVSACIRCVVLFVGIVVCVLSNACVLFAVC